VAALALLVSVTGCGAAKTASPSTASIKTTIGESSILPVSTPVITQTLSSPVPSPSATSSLTSSVSPDPSPKTATIPMINAQELKKEIDDGTSLILVDTRSTKEYAKSHLNLAISIPLETLAARFSEIPNGPRIVVYASCA
jgi:hypothetical protein